MWAVIAVAACHPAPRGPSPRTEAAIGRAEDAERARQHEQARAAYAAAVASAPDLPSEIFARHEFASSLAAWGEIPAAIAQLEAIVARAPGNAPAWHDLGILRHVAGDDVAAAVALRRARDLAPTDPRPRIALAALLWRGGDRAGAVAEYRVLDGLELPELVRAKVRWALEQLAAPAPVAPGSSMAPAPTTP